VFVLNKGIDSVLLTFLYQVWIDNFDITE